MDAEFYDIRHIETSTQWADPDAIIKSRSLAGIVTESKPHTAQ